MIVPLGLRIGRFSNLKLSRLKWHVLLSLISVIYFTVACCAQNTSSTGPCATRFTKVGDLLDRRQCQQAWNEIWRLAAGGDYCAVYEVAMSIAAHPFKMSGASPAAIRKVFLPSVFYATLASGTEEERRFIRETIAPGVLEVLAADIDQDKSKELDCLKSKASPDVCVKMAVDDHLIPSYDEYIRTVQGINRSHLRVSCDSSNAEGLPRR